MTQAIGRANNAGPASDIFPLSGATASSPAILITATTATGGGTVAHTCDAKAYDAPYIRIDNVSAAGVTVFGNIGSLATTGNRQYVISAGSFAVAFAYDVPMSNSGTFSFWSSATTGIFVSGNVSRFFTASSAPV